MTARAGKFRHTTYIISHRQKYIYSYSHISTCFYAIAIV